MATYTGVLTGGQIEWTGGAKPPDGPVRVEVMPDAAEHERRRRAILAAFDSIAARGDLDPEEWERERNEVEARDRHGREG